LQLLVARCFNAPGRYGLLRKFAVLAHVLKIRFDLSTPSVSAYFTHAYVSRLKTACYVRLAMAKGE
jgi:hypothetical protein